MTAHKTGTRKDWLRARLDLLEAEKALTRRSDELASSGSDFNYDSRAAHTKERWQSGAVEYNLRRAEFRPPAGQDSSGLDEFASSVVGTDLETYRREGLGVSAFALEDGVVYHTYSAYERELDGLWGMYQRLGRALLGRDETGFSWRRHDEYDSP